MLAFLDKNEFFDENDILKLKNGLYSYLNKVTFYSHENWYFHSIIIGYHLVHEYSDFHCSAALPCWTRTSTVSVLS